MTSLDSGIVLELQKDSLDEQIPLESLLRKAYLVAKKLDLDKFEKWILDEQNGYKDNVPDYRSVVAELKAWNPFQGWIPVILPVQLADELTSFRINNSVSVLLEGYHSSRKYGSVGFSVNPHIEEFLNKNIFNDRLGHIATKYSFFVATADLYRIFNIVRNHILEWSILLEKNGIIGENLSFNDEEKKRALTNPTIINYTNNFYSDINKVDVKQGN